LTYGKSQGTDIEEIYGAYVFKPIKARGKNGVILEKFLGIGDIRELMASLFEEGF
jgi:hypothetical protein